MKGIELPINILVIIAVAVIVLLGVIALYFGGFMGPAGVMTQNAAKTKYCAIVVRSPTGCQASGTRLWQITINDFDANRDGTVGDNTVDAAMPSACTVAGGAAHDNLASLLVCYYGITSESNGLKSCGCA